MNIETPYLKNNFFYQFIQNKNLIYYILLYNFLIRCFVASFTNLSNDEVYYTLYAKYLDWSYFDHPPLVGWSLWATTFGNFLREEFFVRLSAIIFGTINLYLIFTIGKLLKDHVTGIISALLFAASFYATIISGTFIMPDTPQSIFWLTSLYLFISFIKTKDEKYLIFFGVSTGFAMLGKYHAVFLWLGVFLYLLLKDRKYLFNVKLYIGIFLSLIIIIPVIIWNLTSGYSGLFYLESRVAINYLQPNLHYFFPELFGEIFYNNPFNFFLIIVSLITVTKNKTLLNNNYIVFLICTSIPLILTILFVSFYNRTLPHWTGPSYFSFMLLIAYTASETSLLYSKKFRVSMYGGQILLFVTLILAIFQMKTGLILQEKEVKTEELGKNDPTLDMFLWNKTAENLSKEIPKKATIITHSWFPGAHLDFYFAEKNESKVYVFGETKNLLQYVQFNTLRGPILKNENAYYITTSRHYQEIPDELRKKFNHVSERKTITINSGNVPRINVFIWNLQESLTDLHITIDKKR